MTEVEAFLKKHKQSTTDIDIEQKLIEFTSDMKSGLSGEGSIPMIPTYICDIAADKIKKYDKRILIDAGGTNFRSAIGFFDGEGKPRIESIDKTVMPASDKLLSKNEFYASIAENVKSLLPIGGDVGFCFSYQVDMDPDIDGTVAFFSKEIKAPEVLGTRVGECTLEAIKKYDDKGRRIVVLNDTVATLLGGMAENADKEFSAYIGYIYGTGTNVCYIEKNENIVKVPGLPEGGSMLINMECGNFDKFEQGDYDKAVAANSSCPDKQLFEKMASGKYLSDIIALCLKGFADENLFSQKTEFPAFELKDVSDFLSGEENKIFSSLYNTADRTTAKEICRELIDRAAKMGAIINAAAAIVSGKAKGAPVAIVAEGTTFHKLTGYRANFEKYLDEILRPKKLEYKILQGKELNLIGTLMATMALS